MELNDGLLASYLGCLLAGCLDCNFWGSMVLLTLGLKV